MLSNGRPRSRLAPRITFSELCNFTEKQWQATDVADAYKFTLFGGARGPGKSYWLRWYSLRFLLMCAEAGIRNVQTMLACENYPTLKDRQIGKIADEFPDWLGTLKDTKDRGYGFHLHSAYGGGSILLRNLDDPEKYQSAEFALVAVDEITRNPASTFDTLRGSLRWPEVPETKFIAASNPAPNWVRDYWIEGTYPEALADRGDDFAFVPALPHDNPYLSEEYWQELRSQPKHIQRAWLFGDWYVAVPGVVYSEFTDDNVTEAEPNFDLPIEIGFDDGYIHPRVMLFIQQQGPHVLVFDEIYHTKMLEEDTVRAVVDKCVQYGKRAGALNDGAQRPDDWDELSLREQAAWCRQAGVPLPDIAVGSTEANQLRRRFRMADIPARGGTHKVVDGIKAVRALVLDGRGHRTLQVNKRCRHLLDEIRAGYRYPEETRGDEEKPLKEHDDGCDALRYWIYLRARP